MKINKRSFLLSATASAGLACMPVSALAEKTEAVKDSKPNILIIFTDDQGYADLGCMGSKNNKTPRFDKLASEGTIYTQFYAQQVCGPSRSALLTGRYPHRSRGWGMPASEITIAEKMKEAGYQTVCIGKWDVSNRKPIIDRMPNAQGFEYYYGTLGGNDSGNIKLYENNKEVGSTKDMAGVTRLYTDKAIDYLKNKRDKKKPFLLYLAHTMTHMNIDATPKFKGKSKGGLYGDVVEELDYETGRLLDTLDELDVKKNTLVIYTTDNGPWNQERYITKKLGFKNAAKYKGKIFWGDSGPLRSGKGSCYEGGSRVPCIIRWPGKVPSGKKSNAIFATIDFMPTFAYLAGFNMPTDRKIDGVNQTSLLLGNSEKGARDDFLYNRYGVRKGKWKYIKANPPVPEYTQDSVPKNTEQLYDLENDIGETTNLAEKYPEKLAELKKHFENLSEQEKRQRTNKKVK